MEELAILLRCLQLYTHNSHNLIKGETFFQDHEFLGELYPIYEAAYDSIVERMIGLENLQPKKLLAIQTKAMKLLEGISQSQDSKEIFKTLLTCEEEIQASCKKLKVLLEL